MQAFSGEGTGWERHCSEELEGIGRDPNPFGEFAETPQLMVFFEG
jgi:hypothetical protein